MKTLGSTKSYRVLSGAALRPQAWRLTTGRGDQSGWRLGAGVAQVGAQPWLVLHGGPGSGASPGLLAAFDAARHSAWAPHQRGCWAAGTQRAGRLPVSALVDDLEALRLALGVPRWAVLGGSWGAYLALAYLRRYPAAVTRLVLRGSFLARSADVWNLLRAMPAAALRAAGLPAPAQRGQWSAWLHRAQRLLRFATAHPARLPLTQIWLLAEYRCAVRGAGRAWRHAVQPEPPTVADDRRFVPAAAHLHTAWRKLRQGQRQAEVALRTRRAVPQAQQRKVLLQARWLARGCDHALHGALPTWRAWLAQAAQQSSGLAVGVEAAAHAVPPLLWLHGRFDAVCQPRNALRLQAMLADPAWPQAVQGRWVHGGHLATEPAMAQALRQVLRGPSC